MPLTGTLAAVARAFGGAGVAPAQAACATGSKAFLARVRALRQLSDFLVREGTAPESNPATALAYLQDLTWQPNAALPSVQEWERVESALCALHAALTPGDRKKYQLRQFPPSILALAIATLIIALLAFTGAVYPSALQRLWTGAVRSVASDPSFTTIESSITLWDFLVWNVCLGVMGSIAFISVNALSIQADASFDITNRAFVYLRIILGALFGVMVAVPVAYPNFVRFCAQMSQIKTDGAAVAEALNASQVVYLLLPFLIGFSTTLFLSLISRLLGAVQTLFGIGDRRTTTTAADGTRTVETVREPSGPSSMLG